MTKFLEAWERLRRRHFIQVWSMIYARRNTLVPENWAIEQVNNYLQTIFERWKENGHTNS